MSTPTHDGATPGGSAPAPTVSTAPAAPTGHRWWSAIPSHLGRARTSTVILSLLFVATFALWLQVKPEETQTVPTGVGSVQQQPAAPTTAVPAPATTAPPTPDEPEPRTEEQTTTRTERTTTAPTRSSPAPTTAEAPEETHDPAPTTPPGPAGEAGTTAPTTP